MVLNIILLVKAILLFYIRYTYKGYDIRREIGETKYFLSS